MIFFFSFLISVSFNERIDSSGCGCRFCHGQQRAGTCSYRGWSGESKSYWLIAFSLFYIPCADIELFVLVWFSECVFVQVVQYLGGCGLCSCALLVSKGYPDIGWNPVEGERYLDFLRFAVFCNGNDQFSFGFLSWWNLIEHLHLVLIACSPHTGESVEENAYVVVRLLIRRPECFGPALRGEGGNGLLATMEEAIRISHQQDETSAASGHSSNPTLWVLRFSFILFFSLSFI